MLALASHLVTTDEVRTKKSNINNRSQFEPPQAMTDQNGPSSTKIYNQMDVALLSAGVVRTAILLASCRDRAERAQVAQNNPLYQRILSLDAAFARHEDHLQAAVGSGGIDLESIRASVRALFNPSQTSSSKQWACERIKPLREILQEVMEYPWQQVDGHEDLRRADSQVLFEKCMDAQATVRYYVDALRSPMTFKVVESEENVELQPAQDMWISRSFLDRATLKFDRLVTQKREAIRNTELTGHAFVDKPLKQLQLLSVAPQHAVNFLTAMITSSVSTFASPTVEGDAMEDWARRVKSLYPVVGESILNDIQSSTLENYELEHTPAVLEMKRTYAVVQRDIYKLVLQDLIANMIGDDPGNDLPEAQLEECLLFAVKERLELTGQTTASMLTPLDPDKVAESLFPPQLDIPDSVSDFQRARSRSPLLKAAVARVDLAIHVLALRDELSSSRWIGVFGAQGTGKSTIMKPVIQEYGARTFVPRARVVQEPGPGKPEVGVIDFPGLDDEVQTAAVMGPLCKDAVSIIVVCDDLKKCKAPKAFLREVYEPDPVMHDVKIVLTKCDTVAKLLTGPESVDGLKSQVIREYSNYASNVALTSEQLTAVGNIKFNKLSVRQEFKHVNICKDDQTNEALNLLDSGNWRGFVKALMATGVTEAQIKDLESNVKKEQPDYLKHPNDYLLPILQQAGLVGPGDEDRANPLG